MYLYYSTLSDSFYLNYSSMGQKTLPILFEHNFRLLLPSTVWIHFCISLDLRLDEPHASSASHRWTYLLDHGSITRETFCSQWIPVNECKKMISGYSIVFKESNCSTANLQCKTLLFIEIWCRKWMVIQHIIYGTGSLGYCISVLVDERDMV